METSPNLKRCFIAIDLPKEVITEVQRIQNQLKKKNLFLGKFIELENLHLTLKFFGEITDEKVQEVKEKLNEIKQQKFKASLGSIGVFSTNTIRIIWIKLTGKPIWTLQEKIDEKTSEVGFDKEKRFMSHMTIARIKKILKDRKQFLDGMKKINVKKLEFEVDKFYLMQSELTPEGPVYEVLGEWELKAI